MGTLQTDVNGFNNRSQQQVYTVKAPNSGDANSGHLRIADTFSWNGRN